MNNLIKYFYPDHDLDYLERLKTQFFILQIFIGAPVIIAWSVYELFSPHENFIISFFSKISYLLFFIISLFAIKKKGVKVAGNIFSIALVLFILIWMNILKPDVSPLFKYVQGFYSVLMFLVLGILFATRPVILLNSFLILLSTTHIYIYSISNHLEQSELLSTGYINHVIVLIFITLIIFFAKKFTDSTISKLKENTKNIELNNQELIASEEEIRATNEKLIATTDALKESNEELIRAKEKAEENYKLKDRFLKNMSHEVRTPMNGIIGFSKLLKRPEITKEDQIEFTNIINKSSTQLLRIIDDILEISKLQTNQQRIKESEICINNLISDLYAVFSINAKEKDIQLIVKKVLSDIESTVIIDGSKLQKILSNIVENALKFTNSGYVEFGYELKDNKLEFFVKDTGIGIDSNKHEAIFERFVQEDNSTEKLYGGLGLGLSIVKENTKLLKGEISVDSEKGKGTIIYISIPYKPVKYAIKNEQSSIKQYKNAGKEYSVLIAEDDNINFIYLDKLLKLGDIKFNILRAKNGEEAINICKENNDIKLVFMDLKMPKINGIDATLKIKSLIPEIIIIAQSAYNTQEEIDMALSAGCEDFITKPIDHEKLKYLLNKHLL